MAKATSRSITISDVRAAANLKRLWDKRKREWPHLTQEWAAGQYGCTQGLISQYLLGRTAIGTVATLKLANILKVQPKQIRDDFDLGIPTSDLSPAAIEVAYKWLALPPQFQADVLRNIDNLLSVGADSYAKFLAQQIELGKKQSH